jgi:hypothetical protein
MATEMNYPVGMACYQTYGTYTVGTATNMSNQFIYAYYSTIYGTTVGSNQETKAQRAKRELEERRWQRKEVARRKRAKAALFLMLTKTQREQLKREQSFELQVNARLYRIRPGSRVERLDPVTKKAESYFCIHPELGHDLPQEDVAIGQKLLLEANEQEFLRIANETKAA